MYSFGLPILNEIVAVMVMVCWVVGRGDIGPSAGLVDRSMEVINCVQTAGSDQICEWVYRSNCVQTAGVVDGCARLGDLVYEGNTVLRTRSKVGCAASMKAIAYNPKNP